MSINLKMPDITELKPRITVFGVGGAGGNAVNNMIETGLDGVDFVVANTDAQALTASRSDRVIQMGVAVTEGLGAGSQPEVGRAAAEEVIDEINDHLAGSHMAFITGGMGGGTGTGAAPVVARAAREQGILTVGVVTKPFHFEGQRRMRIADMGIEELQKNVDTLIVIPNQNLFRIANEKTTFADAFSMADEVLYSGVACITDLMVKEGLINLDFADVRSIMRDMGKAMMGTGEASGDKRAIQAAEAAIANPLLDDVSMKGAQGLLISITGGQDMTLFEVDEAATRIREEVDEDANIILGATFDDALEGSVRVSVVATGIDHAVMMAGQTSSPAEARMAELAARLSSVTSQIETAKTPETKPQETAPVQAQAQAPVQVQKPMQPRADAPMPSPLAKPAAQPAPAAKQVERELSFKPIAPEEKAVPSSDPAVTIQPMRVDPAAMRGPEPEAEIDTTPKRVVEQERPRTFVPPAAERPDTQPRMPRVEDFPAVAQVEMKAQAEKVQDAVPAPAAEEGEDARPRGLLKRIASVGFGGRHHEAEAQAPAAPRAPVAPASEPALQPLQQQAPQQRRPLNEGLYAPRQGQLDNQGRPAARQDAASQAQVEEELEIPAFLRR